MKLKVQWTKEISAAALGAFFTFAVGAFLLQFDNRGHWGRGLQHASYDRSFELGLFPPKRPAQPEVIIVYLDDESHRDLNQPFDQPWDRALHARLVDRMTDDGAKAVVFDILFDSPGLNVETTQQLEQAIRRNQKVILASSREQGIASSTGGEQPELTRVVYPFEPLMAAAAGYGLCQVEADEDFVVREHFHARRDRDDVSLSWATARLLGLKITQSKRELFTERWLKYYSGADSIPYVSYRQVFTLPDQFFKDKVVFVGSRPTPGNSGGRRDEFRSPFTSWTTTPRFMPGVEVHATMLINLVANDWLHRFPPIFEWAIIYGISMVGFGLAFLRLSHATMAAIGAALLVTLGGLCLASKLDAWFPWVILVVQILFSLIYTTVSKSVQWYLLRRKLEEQRKIAFERIREQAALLDKAQDAIIVQELLGRITYWNKSAERVYGWSQMEAVGQNCESLLQQKEDPKIAEAHKSLLEKGEWNGELRQQDRTNKEIIVESRWTLVRDDKQKPSSILMINTDVTERKKLEAQFLRNQRMESIGTLAGGIAHDLNNVLAPIVMGVEIMTMKEKNPESIRMLKILGGSAKRGSDMVKQVLSFARGQEGEKSLLQITHLIKEMDKILQETFPKSITFKTEIPEALLPVMGDATQVHQVLLNLCVNARDAMPDGGSVLIRAVNTKLEEPLPAMITPPRAGSYVQLSVTDTGTGIPAHVIERIFEPFFTTKEIGKGTGLGLSTVVSIVKAHNGILDLKTEVGKGTTFIVYLPHAENANPTQVETIAPEHLLGHGEAILVVDDEENVRQVTAATLESHRYEVLLARNGKQAVDIFKENPDRIAVVIMDMMMPVMNGATAIRMIKEIRPDVRIIANSGLLDLDRIKEETGATDLRFLVKPFGAESLLLAVRNALAEETPQAPQGVSEPTPATHA